MTEGRIARAALRVAVKLPRPEQAGPISVEAALRRRRSCREFAPRPIAVGELSRLLWAAQGVNRTDGGRTAPSAGALYPLRLYAAVGAVEGLSPAVYRYEAEAHALAPTAAGDVRRALADAALDQTWMADAAVVIAIAASGGRMAARYGARGGRYLLLEAGHAAGNLCLQAAARGLGTVVVGAFDDAEVLRVLGGGIDETPLLLIPCGWP